VVNPSVESEVMKKNKNPNFRDLKGYMHYRGTMESLTEQMVLVILYKDDFFDSI
jgi:centrosomal protein CEP76